MRRLLAFIGLLALGLSARLPSAYAGEPAHCGLFSHHCTVRATKPATPPKPPGQRGGNRPTAGSKPTDPTREQKQAQARWLRAVKAYDRCLSQAAQGARTAASCGPSPLNASSIPLGQITGVTMTPGQAGAIAAARLQLPRSTPGIGPSPDLNPWKMAAVGYPLWLWLDGPTDVGPVADSVGGLSVSLDAHVRDLSFSMGDGHVVQCVGTGRRWTSSVPTGAKSPACGYAYPKPSLPKGSYTVTAIATWSVRWTVDNQSGVIIVPVAGDTQLPVGELQVLVR